MNYKVTFRKNGYDNETIIYVESESAEDAAKAIRIYYCISHDDILSVEPK